MESLPNELICQIGRYLSLTDRTRFRLTCWTYYSIFPDPLENVFQPHQRCHYYRLTSSFERYPRAVDYTPSYSAKMAVAMQLCRDRGLSLSLVMPHVNLPIKQNHLLMAREYGLRDPRIYELTSDTNSIAGNLWTGPMRELIQRSINRTLILIVCNFRGGWHQIAMMMQKLDLSHSRILIHLPAYPSGTSQLHTTLKLLGVLSDPDYSPFPPIVEHHLTPARTWYQVRDWCNRHCSSHNNHIVETLLSDQSSRKSLFLPTLIQVTRQVLLKRFGFTMLR
jgi:hypothetical protein